MNSDYSAISVTHLTSILMTLICILFVWWLLQSVRFDLFMKNPSNFQIRALQVTLSIIAGYLLGQFFIDYLYWSSMLKWLF